jgi:hypothetical protein
MAGDVISRLALVVDSSGAVAGYRAASTAAEQTAQAELQLARAAEASARASQAGIAAANASAQAKLAQARAVLDLARAQDGATSASTKAEQAAVRDARASASAAQAKLAEARAVTTEAAARRASAGAFLEHNRASAGLASATNDAGQSAKGARVDFGNLGQQLQDVAVQASSGTSALVILAQQGPQVASAFGPVGIAVGAAVAVAAAGALVFLGLGSASEKAARAAEDQAEKTEDLLKALRVGGNTAEAFAASLDRLTTAQRSQAAASLSAELDKRREELEAARAELEKASEAVPQKGAFAEAQAAAPGEAAFFLPATGSSAQSEEMNRLLEAFQRTGEGADFLRTRIIELLQQQGVSASAARAQADAVINAQGSVTALEKATEELAARQRIAAGTASDLDHQLVNQADSARKAASAFESYTSTLDRLQQRNQAGANKREQFIQEQLQQAKVSDLDPAKRPEAEQNIRQQAGARFDADERIRLDEKRADVAGRLRIQEQELSGAIDARVRIGERAYAQTLQQTEGDTALAETAKRIALREYDRQQAIEKRNAAQTKANATADRRTQFETGLDQEQEQLEALKGAIDQGSDAYERQKNVLEVMRRVRAAGYDLTTAEGQAVLARTAQVRNETEALDRQAAVRKDLDNIIRRATAAPGLGAAGQQIDLPGLVGLTPQAIDEVVARAEFVRGIIEKLGDQPPEVVDAEVRKGLQGFDLRKAADEGTKGARATAQLAQEAEQQERLASVINGTAAARREMTDRIAAENKALSIHSDITTKEAQELIASEIALRQKQRVVDEATQSYVEYADAAVWLKDRLAELRAEEEAGLDPSAAARKRRELESQGRRKDIEQKEATDDPIAGAEAGLLRLQERAGTVAGVISENLATGIDDGVTGFLELAKAGELSFATIGEALSIFGEQMAMEIARTLILRGILAAMGMGPTTAPSGFGAGSGGTAVQGHQGGMVGEGLAMRRTDPMWFANAPRYHAGGLVLGRDEVPIIAQRGERVQSRQEVAASRGGGTKIEVYDQRGKDAPPIEQERGRDGNGMETIKLMIRREQNENVASGGMDRTLQGRFKMARQLR